MDMPWLQHYDAGVSAQIDTTRYANFAAWFDETMARYRERIAYHHMGVEITYHKLDELSARLAMVLTDDLGLREGDRVALMMPNVIQYPISVFAALRAGLVVVNINPLYTVAELGNVLADARPRAIIVLETACAVLEQALRRVCVDHVLVANLSDLQPFPKRPLIDWVVRRRRKLVAPWRIEGARPLRALLLAARPPRVLNGGQRSSIAFLQYTGGTTGTPKGAVLTHANVVSQVQCLDAWFAPIFDPAGGWTLIALPLYHVSALMCQCLSSLATGTSAVLLTNARDLASVIDALRRFRPQLLSGINTLLAALMNHPEFSTLDFSRLRFTGAGGTATQPAVAKRWREMTGVAVCELYGLSEVTGACTGNPVTTRDSAGTIGLALPSVEVQIRDDDGRPAAPGQPGELMVRGPVVMSGYYQRPEETARAIGADGFFATGDIATMDERGFLRIVDRKKDMILVSGFNVYPTEIEAALGAHPGILEIAVVGVAHPKSGETPVACVVRRDPALDQAGVIAYARTLLTAYKVPRAVVFLDTLPKTPVGKVLRRELRERAEVRSAGAGTAAM